MNLKNILWVRNTGHIVPNAPIADNLFGLKLSDSGVITTATGNPISIVTNKAQNAISTILSYSPKQSGSGDPSPSNIRPIEGWTEANLFGCGKNIFDKDSAVWKVGYVINAEGVETEHGSYACTENYIPVEANKNYVFSGNIITVGTYNSVALYDKNKTFLYREQGKAGQPSNFTTPNNAAFIRFNVNKNVFDPDTIQIELGSTATTYEPYTQGANNTLSLGGTYYGFSIDVERGKMSVTTKAVVYDGTEMWDENGSSGYYLTVLGESIYTTSELMCDCLKGLVAGGSASAPNNTIRLTSNKHNLLCMVDRTNDFPATSDWTNFLSQNPMIVVYPLTTPLELPLTPQTVALLAGNNTIWTDGDEVTLTYKAKKEG